ncbi:MULTISPECIES: hypothetical protein [unclassified Moorena]|uniref:Uncharacterized protein n=1 Tax=Moorena producens 3L TaxID=489825 RepID=F4Y054_9CYAN|nr:MULTISPECIES: hypothetical protein [unclassified Moorena]EGJ29786.1 hypothetical protein LYNGBM3L_60150 [Moorena producens 3L]NEP34090.1 hypothetical protein [Moorena sp. SIO3B2]NEQ08390.1 hypothetical protein [Moorena sp. SIO4E2]NER91847.1 hypothetical protein [Moorena sp. SIO3A2]NES44225.1 hypothetical protein [Moorena sp. SIO2C4]
MALAVGHATRMATLGEQLMGTLLEVLLNKTRGKHWFDLSYGKLTADR